MCRIKNTDGYRWWPWGPSQAWIALTIHLTWDLTHILQPGALLQLHLGPLASLRWTTRVAASGPAPELLWGCPRLPSDMRCVMPDAHLGHWWLPCIIHSEFPWFAFYDKPCIDKHFLIFFFFCFIEILFRNVNRDYMPGDIIFVLHVI